jgi:hypothetical protein
MRSAKLNGRDHPNAHRAILSEAASPAMLRSGQPGVFKKAQHVPINAVHQNRLDSGNRTGRFGLWASLMGAF